MGLTDAVLAIDAGNSKTDVALVSPGGELLARARTGPFRPHRVGARAAVDAIAPAVADVLAAAGAGAAGHVSACLANADFPPEVEALEEAVAQQGWGGTATVVNDILALLRAGLDGALLGRRGVAVVCGAGINCIGVREDGTTVRFPAVGHLSGDWGGGWHLWQEAMWWGARAEDGRGPETALRTALPRHHGLGSMTELIEAVHLGVLGETRCLELVPVLFEVAAAGDDVAADVVRRQADEVVAMAAAAVRRLGLLAEPVDVVLGGGVLTAGHGLLVDRVHQRLAELAPRAAARVVDAPPVLGAALLGLDHLGAAPRAEHRLRAVLGA